jgi:hypothetical protein
MRHNQGKAQKAWVAILAFCLFVFIAVDCMWIYVSVIGWLEPRKIIGALVVCLWCTWVTFKALRQRISGAVR